MQGQKHCTGEVVWLLYLTHQLTAVALCVKILCVRNPLITISSATFDICREQPTMIVIIVYSMLTLLKYVLPRTNFMWTCCLWLRVWFWGVMTAILMHQFRYLKESILLTCYSFLFAHWRCVWNVHNVHGIFKNLPWVQNTMRKPHLLLCKYKRTWIIQFLHLFYCHFSWNQQPYYT